MRRARRGLLPLHQLPTSPSRPRVKTSRRLQPLGAVAIRNAVDLLPDSSQAREDFEWLKEEIRSRRGEAGVFAADTIDRIRSSRPSPGRSRRFAWRFVRAPASARA